MPKALLQGIPQCPPGPSSEPCGYRPRALCAQLLQCPLAVIICLCWARGHWRPWTKKKPSSPPECCLGISLEELLPLSSVTAHPPADALPCLKILLTLRAENGDGVSICSCLFPPGSAMAVLGGLPPCQPRLRGKSARLQSLQEE